METTHIQSLKDEILTLILADMRNKRLLIGLEATGLVTEDFNSSLVDLIFYKIDLPKQYEDKMESWYEETIYNLLEMDIYYFRIHHEFLAHKFYDAICEKKNQLINQLPEKLSTNFYSILWWLKLNKYK